MDIYTGDNLYNYYISQGIALQNISDSTNCYPFHNVANDDFETLRSVNRLSQSDMDRLSQIRFKPFEPNQNTVLSDNNVELDSSFNTNKHGTNRKV